MERLPPRSRPRTIMVAVADGDGTARRGLIEAVQEAEGVVVVGEAADRAGVFDLLRSNERRPDVLVLDADLPGGGYEAARRVRTRYPGVGLVVVGSGGHWRDAERAVRVGARGYIGAVDPPQKLVETVRRVAAGGDALEGHRAWVALQESAPTQRGEDSLLTRRQVEVLLALRRKADDAAGVLGISDSTLKAHIKKIGSRLGLDDRAEVIAYASSHRYLVGRGADFIGIWDAERGDAPIERFDPKFAWQARVRLLELTTPHRRRFRWQRSIAKRLRRLLARLRRRRSGRAAAADVHRGDGRARTSADLR